MSASLTSIRVAGALLPSDVLAAVLAGDLDGLSSSAYHLGGESPREAAARVWTHLLGVYRRFRDELQRLSDEDPAVGLTRERWLTLLLSELGYGRVPLTPSGGLTVADKQYPVSHLWGATPIHLLGWGVPLDKRTPGVRGAAQRAPHAMVQELLNRTDTYLWALLSNGRVLRLLRDSTTLTGQAYVEFDLEAMFDGELFAEFALLYLLCHQSRVEVPDGGQPTDCWLEKWRATAVSQGIRALNLLRDGVQQALETLGTGVLRHPANSELRQRLAAGDVRLTDVHAALLRTVYRLLFWAVAEDRQALLSPDAGQQQRQRYANHFSSARLRALALRRHGSGHDDLWQAVSIVLGALGRPGGEPRLGLPGLGGLFTPTAADVLAGTRLPNVALLSAVRALSVVQPKGQPRRLVDFAHLGAEELGSIYESLLELVPRLDPTTHVFTLETLAGNDRKTSGSYYTPSDLVELVLDAALDPVLDDAEKSARTAEEAAAALLALKVCDPAIGSGHFMVAAARRIAGRLAAARTGELDPTPTAYSDALHDVIARCIYGVDVNPMAADLAKVSLWLTAMSPGRPLSFLDHHIKVGNALLGTTPALLHAGIPDGAYVALVGANKSLAAASRKRNASEREGQGDLFDDAGIDVDTSSLRTAIGEVADRAASAKTVDDVAWAAQRYADVQGGPAMIRARNVADGWCAAFLGAKTPQAEYITHRTLEALAEGTASGRILTAVGDAATRHRLFHWHLEFPEVFSVPDGGPTAGAYGWVGGFDSVLGNPPWDQVQLHPNEFFAASAPHIAEAPTMAKRDVLIRELRDADPDLFAEYEQAKEANDATKHFVHASGAFRLTAFGRLNTYSLFAERFTGLLATHGVAGIVTPTGLMTDSFNRHFAESMLTSRRLDSFFDFENEARIFPGVHNQFRFAVAALTGGDPRERINFAFYTRHVSDVPDRRYDLAPDEIRLLNPNSGTLPLFRTRRDANITLKAYKRHPVLMQENPVANPWGLTFLLMFMMNTASHLFETAESLAARGARYDNWSWTSGSTAWLPLYEAKMLGHWNHRQATYEGASVAQLNKGTLPRLGPSELASANVEARPLYWMESVHAFQALPQTWDRDWLLGWRSVARASDVRTFVPSALPRTAVSAKFPLAFPANASLAPLLQAIWSSLIFDYIARQKQSGADMPYHIVRQLACPTPEAVASSVSTGAAGGLEAFMRSRVLELVYTSSRMASYAKDVIGAEDPGMPFRWIPERRVQMQAELDAALLHLYGLDRPDAEHVLDSFFVLRKYEERDLGEFRTKRLVLAAFDAMAVASTSGVPFSSPLDPPPGEGPRHRERAV